MCSRLAHKGQQRFVLAAAATAALVLLSPRPAPPYPPAMSRDDIMDRARPAVGYSYWWGGSCWCGAGSSCSRGSCSGSCPSCTHYGPYGADCSGFVNKVWQVPDPISLTHCYHGPYVAASYQSSSSYWSRISRDSLARGDAVASSHHVVLYESGNGWGSMWMYEARGCSYGIQHNLRGLTSDYSAARRINISECECTPGHTETRGCGDCGSQTRTCQPSCRWGAWGTCRGEGVCRPGAEERRGCGDCGTQTRTCRSSCEWGGWGACTGQGECSPGATQTGECGWCGTRSRSCGPGCSWGGWGACTGQGECPAGSREERACCDCGGQSRVCDGACRWGGWSDCAGPDPEGGTIACDTGECGPCADGRVRCIEGCRVCKRIYEPVPELCDDIDNDCDCEADEGSPDRMGAAPPRWGALLLDFSAPSRLDEGEVAALWVEFKNMGSETWLPGEVWLVSTSALAGEPSPLYAAGRWRSWQVASMLDVPVAPGGQAVMELAVQTADYSLPQAEDEFQLVLPDGRWIKCPESSVTFRVLVSRTGRSAGDEGAVTVTGEPSGAQQLTGGCACAFVDM